MLNVHVTISFLITAYFNAQSSYFNIKLPSDANF